VDEITSNLKGPVALYGHCAGSTLAVEIARQLEARDVQVSAVHVAAMLPIADPDDSLQYLQGMSDDAFYDYLRSLGGLDGDLDAADISRIVQAARHDAVLASRFFQTENTRSAARLRAPMQVIVGDADPATAGYAERFVEWGRFAETVSLSLLPTADHYFVKRAAPDVAKLLTDFHRRSI
jgi:nonribosomal peptide synthetase DhbF